VLKDAKGIGWLILPAIVNPVIGEPKRRADPQSMKRNLDGEATADDRGSTAKYRKMLLSAAATK
jgi:hypothetical protein